MLEAWETLDGKVLVVDDDPSFHRLIESLYAPAQIECVCVRSAEEALKCFTQGVPRGVILDGLLPGMRGDELAVRLRKMLPREKLPIVFVSAFFRDLKTRNHLLKVCGVDAVLHKPISVDALRRALASIAPLSPPLPAEPSAGEHEVSLPDAAELLAEYLALSAERVKAMRSALDALDGAGRAQALALLKTEAHRFRGSGKSYGVGELSRLGARIEAVLESAPKGGLRAADRAQLTGLVEALAAKVARAGAAAPIPTTPGRDRPLELLVLDAPGELAASCAEAPPRNARIRLAADPAAAVAAVAEAPPDVAFVSLGSPALAGLDAAKQLKAAGAGAVVVMATDGALQTRLAALAGGIDGYVHPLPDAAALERVAREFARPRIGARVVALDADLSTLGAIAEALAPQRLDVDPCTDPQALFDHLERVEPALLILSAKLPGLDALELVRAVRADLRFRRLPVLLLSADDSPQARLSSHQAGADGVVTNPFTPNELALAAAAHAGRHLRETQDASTDRLTGLLERHAWVRACDRAIRLARRGRTLALLVFDADPASLEGTRLVTDERIAVLAARLVQRFRETDSVARIGTGRFAVLLHDLAKEDAQRLLDASLAALRQALGLEVRGAMAAFPEVGGGAEALLEAAERQLQ